MTQDTQVYRFFLDNPPSNTFLFTIKLLKNFAPQVGDSLTDPLTQRDFKVMRAELIDEQGFVRVTDQGDLRVTDDGKVRVTKEIFPIKDQTLDYFVQPANNPTRVSTWTQTDFANDKTLDQLYNNRWS